mmetsp:Transcript_8903/g.14835  ORF Transcript_8903/g.14835 Transcript_8903/m.14835 type:complete len:255 (+) Transcript_8903:51-815(+)
MNFSIFIIITFLSPFVLILIDARSNTLVCQECVRIYECSYCDGRLYSEPSICLCSGESCFDGESEIGTSDECDTANFVGEAYSDDDSYHPNVMAVGAGFFFVMIFVPLVLCCCVVGAIVWCCVSYNGGQNRGHAAATQMQTTSIAQHQTSPQHHGGAAVSIPPGATVVETTTTKTNYSNGQPPTIATTTNTYSTPDPITNFATTSPYARPPSVDPSFVQYHATIPPPPSTTAQYYSEEDPPLAHATMYDHKALY